MNKLPTTILTTETLFSVVGMSILKSSFIANPQCSTLIFKLLTIFLHRLIKKTV